MTSLTDACDAVSARKSAVFNSIDHELDMNGLVLASEEGERLMLSGFGVDRAEFKALADQAGYGFAGLAMTLNLPTSCAGAWAEGLIVGLMFAQLTRAEELRGKA